MSDIDEVHDALEMMGKGYSQPAVIIQPPEVRIERHNGKNVEVERPAFVQVFTNFKSELRGVDPVALKVWLYLALSINRFQNTARPAIRTIARDTDMAINTAQDAIKRLEAAGLVVVHRGEYRYNFYDVRYATTERFANVSANDTSETNVSENAQNVSEKPENVSPASDTSLEGLEGLDNSGVPKNKDAKPDIVDGALRFALSPQAMARNAMVKRIYDSLGVDIQDPDDKRWKPLISHCLQADAAGQPVEKYGEWMRANKYDAPKAGQISMRPMVIVETWPRAFQAPAKHQERTSRPAPRMVD